MKIAAIALAGALIMGGGYDKPDDYVTSFTPDFDISCEQATFSHPAYKGGFGHPNGYLLYIGSSEAEAQAGEPQPYTPGETVTVVFDDPEVSDHAYFELKVTYEGKTFEQKLGHRQGSSTDCAPPVVVEPDPEPPVVEEPEVPVEEPEAPVEEEPATEVGTTNNEEPTVRTELPMTGSADQTLAVLVGGAIGGVIALLIGMALIRKNREEGND